jgi:hypothetical protein
MPAASRCAPASVTSVGDASTPQCASDSSSDLGSLANSSSSASTSEGPLIENGRGVPSLALLSASSCHFTVSVTPTSG